MEDKPTIHISQMTQAERCGVAYHRRHILGEKTPYGTPIHIGQATHTAGEYDLLSKVKTKLLLPDDVIKDIARDKFLADCETYGYRLTPEEMEIGPKKAIGKATDLSVTLASLFHEKLSPVINPISEKHIERKWKVVATGYPFDLGGMIDVQEAKKIDDLKTANATPSQTAIDSSEQYTMYTLAIKVLDGYIPEITQNTLVKTKTPKLDVKHSTRTEDDFRALMARLSRFAEVIEKGVFMPARRDDWWCSLKFCSFAETCPFFNGQVKYFMGEK